ncbi:pyridoxamine 5'-phosphate oxidase family protein [Sphaerisporangium rufum]|uniref:pyridoxamine 5'-phosphate oxidase family protein n=1 Tax=Sphaerisporangium rufum TaxID=1381558 RepID=UPI001EF273D6|nr:pyridoxamine 5'-phosphate oxidase family protein [Sphaerisporangium rufum]
MRTDPAGLRELTLDECMALLAGAPLGRIVYTDRALPAVQPVLFHLDGGAVVIRTSAGSALAAAVQDTVVAFEVDEVDARTRTGWSVTAVGHARVVDDPAETARLDLLPLRRWAPAGHERFILLRLERLTGRRIAP